MHPAFSVIFFTTLSGAGYGSLTLLGTLSLFNWLPLQSSFGICATTLAVLMVTIGLLSSTAHLGRPRRAWRALSQWRSSWLSREGVFAILSYIPISIFLLVFWMPEQLHKTKPIVSVLIILFPTATIYCTAKIYSSLKTIKQWNHQLVVPIYLLIGLFDGAVILVALVTIFKISLPNLNYFTVLLGLLAGILKIYYWRSVDTADGKSTTATATGLGNSKEKVEMLDAPTTSKTFVMREMGYVIARKHSRRLRIISMLTLFIIPVVLIYFMTYDFNSINAISLSLLTIVFAGIGSILERWLFFAEAKHVSMLYYGVSSV
ncbi:MAG: DMSO reductase [Rhodospirillaceae bacterium]|nr:DMSO reductase [Rhodospirillaceae bacterium]|tara:strand:+ start:359 stop:1312 length:954 start_codon:yes stop_codon:yes gene_type:complete